MIIKSSEETKHKGQIDSSDLPKNSKKSIATQKMLLPRQSLDSNNIVEIHKMTYVSPIHQGGSKLLLKQFRPVTFTSHIKVFERVIQKH